MARGATARFVVHRDRDYMEDAEVATNSQALEKFGIHVFVTAGNDIEAYFCDRDHVSAAETRITSARAAELIDEAIAAVREKSIEAIINVRTERAFRRRADGGGGPNHGQIGTVAARDFDANPKAMARGKGLLGKLTASVQKEIGSNPTIVKASPRIAEPSLGAIANKIWPQERQDGRNRGASSVAERHGPTGRALDERRSPNRARRTRPNRARRTPLRNDLRASLRQPCRE